MTITHDDDLMPGSLLPMMVERLVAGGWKIFNHHDNWIHKDYDGEYATHHAYAILHGQPAPGKENILPAVIGHLAKELIADDDYRRGWQANIAMAFKDEYNRQTAERNYIDLGKLDIHEIANTAAANFISSLCGAALTKT